MRPGVLSLRGGDRSGQMTVELAVVTPVAIAVALVVFNLMCFLECCSAFDQLAMDAVLAHGVAPSGEQTLMSGVGEVRSTLAASMEGRDRCDVDVRAEPLTAAGSESVFDASPLLTRFVCTLTYHPWPSFLLMPGVDFGAPFALRHERELVVDRYRPGVVV